MRRRFCGGRWLPAVACTALNWLSHRLMRYSSILFRETMKEILAIAWREIEARIYRRSFYLGSLVLPVLLTLLVVSPLLLLSQSSARREVVVFDQSGDA